MWLAGCTNVETVICPPLIYLSELGHSMSKLKLGAQDVSRFDFEGAHTGEISAKMLKNSGIKYVIVGTIPKEENWAKQMK